MKFSIADLPMFSGLNLDQLEKVKEVARFKELGKKELVFREGEKADTIFYLLSGRIKIYKLSNDGKEHILHMVNPGQGFAEAAVFLSGGYPAFSETLEKSSLMALPKDGFLKLLEQNPEISLNIIANMSQHLKRFTDKIEDLSLKDVSARFARWMLTSSEDHGRDFWDLEITKGELAGQLGTVSETLSRTLRKFKDAGWIQVRGKFMKILDREALEQIAQGVEL